MKKQNRGQTLVMMGLTTLLMVVMVCMTLAITTRIKRKMELQTVADTAAYSNAIATARAYNAMSMLNRVTTSHWVAMMGIESETVYATSPPAYLEATAAAFTWLKDLGYDSPLVRPYNPRCVDGALPLTARNLLAINSAADAYWHASLGYWNSNPGTNLRTFLCHSSGSVTTSRLMCDRIVEETPMGVSQRPWGHTFGKLDADTVQEARNVRTDIENLADVQSGIFAALKGSIANTGITQTVLNASQTSSSNPISLDTGPGQPGYEEATSAVSQDRLDYINTVHAAIASRGQHYPIGGSVDWKTPMHTDQFSVWPPDLFNRQAELGGRIGKMQLIERRLNVEVCGATYQDPLGRGDGCFYPNSVNVDCGGHCQISINPQRAYVQSYFDSGDDADFTPDPAGDGGAQAETGDPNAAVRVDPQDVEATEAIASNISTGMYARFWDRTCGCSGGACLPMPANVGNTTRPPRFPTLQGPNFSTDPGSSLLGHGAYSVEISSHVLSNGPAPKASFAHAFGPCFSARCGTVGVGLRTEWQTFFWGHFLGGNKPGDIQRYQAPPFWTFGGPVQPFYGNDTQRHVRLGDTDAPLSNNTHRIGPPKLESVGPGALGGGAGANMGVAPGGLSFVFPRWPDVRSGRGGAVKGFPAIPGAKGAFGQPKYPVIVTRDHLAPDPWDMSGTASAPSPNGFNVQMTQGSPGQRLDMYQSTNPDKMTAMGTAIAYYHRRRNWHDVWSWKEPPNLLNPFWHATLVPADVDAHEYQNFTNLNVDTTPGQLGVTAPADLYEIRSPKLLLDASTGNNGPEGAGQAYSRLRGRGFVGVQ